MSSRVNENEAMYMELVDFEMSIFVSKDKDAPQFVNDLITNFIPVGKHIAKALEETFLEELDVVEINALNSDSITNLSVRFAFDTYSFYLIVSDEGMILEGVSVDSELGEKELYDFASKIVNQVITSAKHFDYSRITAYNIGSDNTVRMFEQLGFERWDASTIFQMQLK